MPHDSAETFPEIREAVRRLCARFPGPYWRALDRERQYPTEFVTALTEAGFLSVLIPEAYGGSGLGLAAGAAVLEDIHRSGANGGACHAQMYTMGVVLRHGSAEQKAAYLPKVASGELRLQAFGVTEPDAGTDTTRITTFARREGERYVVNGKKLWISRAEHSDLMVLLCRTTPRADAAKPSDGMSVLLVDMREAVGNGLTIRPVRTMLNHATTELFFEDLEVPVANRIGEEGQGFKYIIDGFNPERILVAVEAIGLGRAALKRAAAYAKERVVFGHPIGKNQAIQHPLAECWMELEAADLVAMKAAWQYDNGVPCGPAANAAKYLGAEAGFKACETAVMTHGGYGYAKEFHVERYLRESMIARIAPVTPHLILCFIAEKILGLPRSY